MNYNDLTDAELGNLAAEKFDIPRSIYLYNWFPTHPDSNQAERYLFPKLRKIIKQTHGNLLYQITILLNETEEVSRFCDINPDQINRTKVITALEARDKIKETNKGEN